MKRVLAILTALVFLLIPDTVIAAAKTYTVPEIDLRIDIPEDLIVFLRDVDPNNPNLALLGTDEASLERDFRDQSIFLNAVSLKGKYEITVNMYEEYADSQEIFNFNLLTANQLRDIYENTAYGEEANRKSITYTGYSIVRRPQMAFLRLSKHFPGKGQEVYAVDYCTIVDRKQIDIALYSYDGPATAEQEKVLKEVFDSTDFTKPGIFKRLVIVILLLLLAGVLLVVRRARKREKIEYEAIWGKSED